MLQIIKQIYILLYFAVFVSSFFLGRGEGVDFWPTGGDSTPLLLTFFVCYFEPRALSAVWLLLSIIDSVSVVLMSERRGRNPLFLCPT